MLLFSTILDIDETMTQDSFIRLVLEWNRTNPYESNIIPDITWNGERNVRFGEEGLWLAIEEYRNQNIIAVRFEKKEDDGVIWDTDYVMNFNSMKMAVRLDRSYTEDALESDQKFSTPYFLTLLIEQGYLKEDNGLPVQNSVTEITEDNVTLLTNVINDEIHYTLPIVYVSKTVDDEDPVDVKVLANRLKGVAHVMVQEGNWLNQTIRSQCDDKNEYYGAIGVYFPSQRMNHRRYLYRSFVGYDQVLFDKVFGAVIQYCNSQMIDTLYTWQGVNNALLRDRFVSQRQERLAAEEAQKAAEAEAAKLLDTFDEEERRIRKQAYEEARIEANEILDGFDADMQKLQAQVEALTKENEALQYENHGLKAKLDSRDSEPVLFMGDEYEFYPGEVKDLLLDTLSAAMKGIQDKSRRADIIRDIINNNDFQKLSAKKAETLKNTLKNYDGMSAKTRQALMDLGFEIKEDGKHYKATYYGDSRYQVTYSKTPSDVRSGKNSAQLTMHMVF